MPFPALLNLPNMFWFDNKPFSLFLFVPVAFIHFCSFWCVLSSFQGLSDDREERQRPARRAQFGKGCIYFVLFHCFCLYENAVRLVAVNGCSLNEQNYLRFLPTFSPWRASTPNSRAVPSGSSRGPSVRNHRLQEGAAAGLWREQSDHAGSQSKENHMMCMLNEHRTSSFFCCKDSLIAERPAPDLIICP